MRTKKRQPIPSQQPRSSQNRRAGQLGCRALMLRRCYVLNIIKTPPQKHFKRSKQSPLIKRFPVTGRSAPPPSIPFPPGISVYFRPQLLPPSPPLHPNPLRPLPRIAGSSRMAAALWTLLVVAAAAGCGGEAAATAAETAHEVLRAHGLPRGLLPAGIAEFRHDAGSGRFEAALESACTARFEVGLRYNASVAGVISYGRIAALSGVSAQDLFLWFPVRGIRVDVPSSGVIYFDVGVVFKHFPLAVFEAPPSCTPDPLLLTSQQRREDDDVDGSLSGGAALR